MDWLDTLADYGERAADAYATVRASRPTDLPEPTKATTANTWLVPALIGGGLLVLVLVVLGFSKK